MIAILKKELWSYFGNWSAWVIIAAFSLIATLFLFFFDNDSNIFEIGMASLQSYFCLLYTSPSPRDGLLSRMPSSA